LSCRDFSDSCFIDTSVPSCRTPCSCHKSIQIGESLFVSPIFVWQKFLHERVRFLSDRNSCMKESHLCGRQTESMGVTSVVLYLVHGTECPFSNFVSWVEVPCCCLQLFIQYDTTDLLLMQIKKICWAWCRQLLDFLRTAAKQNEERGNLQK
jgi:hypothetical protein